MHLRPRRVLNCGASDGTAIGTFSIADIEPGASHWKSSSTDRRRGAGLLHCLPNRLGGELWRSDGNGLRHFCGSGHKPWHSLANPNGLANVNNTLYFEANDGTRGSELWKTNGTLASTVLVADINPGPTGSSPGSILALAVDFISPLLHQCRTGIVDLHGYQCEYRTDSRPIPWNNVQRSQRHQECGRRRLFCGNDTGNRSRTFPNRGTASTTMLAFDLNPGTGSSVPTSLVVYRDKLVAPLTYLSWVQRLESSILGRQWLSITIVLATRRAARGPMALRSV